MIAPHETMHVFEAENGYCPVCGTELESDGDSQWCEPCVRLRLQRFERNAVRLFLILGLALGVLLSALFWALVLR